MWFLEDIAIMLLGALLVFLKLTGQLNLYIRKEYFWFAFAAGVVLMLTGLFKFISDIFSKRKVHQHEEVSLFSLLLIILVIVGGFLLPKKPLSSQTAFRRSGSDIFVSGSAPKSLPISNPLLKNADTNRYTIADWIRLFSFDPEPENYVGKSVDVEGFVQPQSDGTFKVSRFVITCCAVDAAPVSLVVDSPLKDLRVDDWVHVIGTFRTQGSGNQRSVIISPEKIEKISVPPNPYL